MEGDEEGATEGVGGATQPTWREALEHGSSRSSYKCEATHIGMVRERGSEKGWERERSSTQYTCTISGEQNWPKISQCTCTIN